MASTWNDLPAEMKFAVVEHLDVLDTAHFSKSNREAYELSIPTLYREVALRGSKALRSFLDSVPASYCRHVRKLCVDMSMDGLYSPQRATTALCELLSRCSRVEDLALHIPGSLRPSIIAHFEGLHDLRKLAISNCGRDEHSPLSERLVVAIAASVPHLTHLVLDRICRSAIHAPELLGAAPFVPVVVGDTDIAAHPALGPAPLSLPSLLLIPSLRTLRLRDTHLGDARWGTTPPQCVLDTLELGSCCYEPPEFNATCAQRILAAVGHSVRELSLGAALQHPCTLPRLTTLHVSPLVPLENLVETLACVGGAPVAALTIECHEDDLTEAQGALKELHDICVERAPPFAQLTSVSLRTVTDLFEPSPQATPRFEFAVPMLSKGAAADAIATLQRCLEDTPATGVRNELYQTEPCAFALVPPSLVEVMRADMMSEEMELWL